MISGKTNFLIELLNALLKDLLFGMLKKWKISKTSKTWVETCACAQLFFPK